MWKTDCEAPAVNVGKRGDSLMNIDEEVEI
jgi:hypothetical protein